MKIIEHQNLSTFAVREMCIENNLYTRGTNEQYEAMFGLVIDLYPKSIITADDLPPIAADILAHGNDDWNMEDNLCGLGKKWPSGHFFDAALTDTPCGR
ncbi:MAG: hypothetical protein ACI4ML_06990 [Aristaeellaceae bacterium]